MDAIPWWGWVAIVLGALFTLPYWLGPVLIHGSHKMPVKPQFDSLPLEGEVPSEVSEYFSETGAEFEKLGFRKVARLLQDTFMPNVKTFIDLWYHSQSGLGVISVAAYGTVKTPEGMKDTLQAKYVQFSASFTDDSAVMTSNSATAEVFAPVEGKRHFKFRTDDLSELFRNHQKLAAHFGRGKTPKDPPTDPAGYLSESMTKELRAQIGTGYLYEEGDYFWPTWKGAILVVYKSLPPFKGWLQASELSNSQKALQQAGG
ncbi:MAG TPA: hypothetical protein VEJ63_02135 [Planctomycetota bacterium]|nr:hypothetical protein [Planctomycetota bacterium]